MSIGSIRTDTSDLPYWLQNRALVEVALQFPKTNITYNPFIYYALLYEAERLSDVIESRDITALKSIKFASEDQYFRAIKAGLPHKQEVN